MLRIGGSEPQSFKTAWKDEKKKRRQWMQTRYFYPLIIPQRQVLHEQEMTKEPKMTLLPHVYNKEKQAEVQFQMFGEVAAL